MFRRFLLKATAGVLTFFMAFAVSLDVTFANDGEYEVRYAVADSTGRYKYEVVDNEARITEYIGKEKNIVIPEALDGYIVTTIGYCSFDFASAETITIPANIKLIEEGAFDYDPSLTDYIVNVGNADYKVVNNSLMTIDGKKIISYPGGRTETLYTVPDGVERIGNRAFENTNLKKVTMPDSLKVVGEDAFSGAKIAEIIFGNGLVTIEKSAFYYSELENVVIPDSVKIIDEWAFGWCSELTSVTLGKNLETIGEYGFYASDNISEITIPASVTSIGVNALTHMKSLAKITVAEGNTSYNVVNEALLTMNGETILAFPVNSQTTTLIIPETVKYISESAFSGAKNLQNVVFNEGLQVIGMEAFQMCTGIKELKLPSTVTELKYNAFVGCSSLERVTIPPKVQILYWGIFGGCKNLKSVFIPSEIRSIDATAFRNATGIEEIYYVGSSEKWASMEYVSDVAEFANAKVYFLGNLKDFVDRMYSVALGREYDAVGLNGWVQHLVEETHDGAGLAKEFILGAEFALRNLSDEQYVDVLYTTFFNREADAAGKELWLGVLASGQTREYVLSQFVNLNEFTLLCAEYGIHRGVMFMDGSVAAPGLPQFVGRLYDEVLSRSADGDGLYNWTAALATKAVTAEEAAVSFFMSQEYAMKNVDSSTFVTDCYSVFMDREADAEGLAFWVSCLEEAGVSREWVIAEFAASEEFKTIAAKYGL